MNLKAPLNNVKPSNFFLGGVISDIIGYKYFGFGGLAEAQKGLKAFEGTAPGNGTSFNLFLTPKTDKAFRINVWIDGPWANETWKG